jgi:imidazole glycerol-phosphate synthase subunit HisH
MSKGRVAIVDYGVGNLFNVRRAIEHVGGAADILRDPEALRRADRLILPGVGAFEAGIDSLRREGLDGVVREFAASGKPVLGICLGMQLLLDES